MSHFFWGLSVAIDIKHLGQAVVSQLLWPHALLVYSFSWLLCFIFSVSSEVTPFWNISVFQTGRCQCSSGFYPWPDSPYLILSLMVGLIHKLRSRLQHNTIFYFAFFHLSLNFFLCCDTFFKILAVQYSIAWIGYNLSNHSSNIGHLDCFNFERQECQECFLIHGIFLLWDYFSA